MIKVENVEVFNFDGAIRGARNPLNSWQLSDSCRNFFTEEVVDLDTGQPTGEYYNYSKFIIGPNDLKLMRKLYQAGSEHRKYLRQIFVSMDVVAPLYWWKEADQYRIGVTTDSCSTMHKIHAKKFTLDDFSHEHLGPAERTMLSSVIELLNVNRDLFNDEKDKIYWRHMIQLLPSSYNQRRTMTMNYENVVSMIHQREFHKLDEWRQFVKILQDLPYVKEIITVDEQ